jgi:hypothetical protein
MLIGLFFRYAGAAYSNAVAEIRVPHHSRLKQNGRSVFGQREIFVNIAVVYAILKGIIDDRSIAAININ